MKTYQEFMDEAVNNFARPGVFSVPGIQKRYLRKDTVEIKDFEFTDGPFVSTGSAFLGLNSKKVWTVVFYSFDLGAEAKIKVHKDEASARETFSKFARRAQSLVKINKFMR